MRVKAEKKKGTHKLDTLVNFMNASPIVIWQDALHGL